MKKIIIISIIASFIASSCAKKGLRITETNTNVDVAIPGDFKYRSLYDDVSIIQYGLSNITGWVLKQEQGTGKWKRIMQIIPPGYELKDKVISDGKFYESKITKNMSMEAGVKIPIMEITSNVDSKNTMELIISDESLMEISAADIPWKLLNDYLTNTPSDGSPRVWVQTAMLTRLYHRRSTFTKANASVQGTVYNVKGNLQVSNTGFTRIPYISMLLIDLDEIENSIKANKDLVPASPGKQPFKVLTFESKSIVTEK